MEKFDLNNIQSDFNAIDIKSYIFKLISYWKLFLVCVIIALLITNYLTKRKERIYKLETVIAVKEEQNPLFSANTNIMFNWGGASDEVETIITILKSREHTEKVVKKQHYYIDYLKEGKYRLNDIYGKNPFVVKLNSNTHQLINNLIKLDFIENNQVKISFEYDNDDKNLTLLNFENFETKKVNESTINFSKIYTFGSKIESPYFNFIIEKTNLLTDLTGKTYYVKFKDFNSTVKHYQNIIIKNFKKGTSLISLEFIDNNKARIEEFLNSSVEILNNDQKNQKIQYAVKTKKYIDTLFNDAAKNLKGIEKDLGNYKQKNRIYDLTVEGQSLFGNVSELDKQKFEISDRLQYYDNLKSYINTNQDIEGIPVPAIIAIEDQTISSSVTQLITLYKSKEVLEQTVTSDFPKLKRIRNEISTTRGILLENLSTLNEAMKVKLSSIENQISKSNSKLRALPKKEQGLIKFQRNYNITATNYEYLKQKQYEAGTAIAANMSNIKVLDTAKDTGQLAIYPKPFFNYLVAFMLGLILPFLYIIVKGFLDNKIHTVEEIENTYSIPVLGVIGKNNTKSNLAVFSKPKSTIAESFRAIRSNMQFLFKDNNAKSKTIVVTSSVSGEGKTLSAINIATVFALSNKKTVLIGFDLRKPKIFDDFNLTNTEGLSNYLIDQKSIEEITINTQIPNLDLILSGPVPPNPSELILNKKTDELFKYLKNNYDYIIVDTPPIGLVADALELFKYADANVYLIRQGYTQKGMPKMIDEKYKNGEVKNISYVLNDFAVNNKYGYGQGYGYGYGNYANGYHQEDEKLNIFQKLFKTKK